MKTKQISFQALVTMAVLLAAGTASAHGRNVNVRHSGRPLESCSQLEIKFDHRPAARAEEERTIPRSSISVLQVPGVESGGVEVLGWDRDDYSVTACKAAEDARLLPQISMNVQGGRVTVKGPDSQDWMVYLIVRAPKGAVMDLEAHNGPIGLHSVNGKISARAVNGPIEMKNCSGEINVETQNGPIEWSGGSGKVRLRAQNGPLNVKLTGTRWEGGTLEGDTHNGPLNLQVPENYSSGVRVDASEHSPVSCHAAACKQALRTWEYPSRIEFGKGTPVVRLSTVNGPVEIE